MKARRWLLKGSFSFVVIIIVASFAVGAVDLERDKVEKPAYTVIKTTDNYELRQYNARIVAQVTIQGSEDGAMNRGFRPLADYIFGNNTAKADIAMTSPVTQQPKQSQKIAMTSPVIQQPAETMEGHVVSFVMPSEYSLETLPTPNNDDVVIKEIDAQIVAAVTFSGFGAMKTMKEYEENLRNHLTEAGIAVNGEVTYARYDPPWTLPNLRRNEVLLPVSLDSKPHSGE